MASVMKRLSGAVGSAVVGRLVTRGEIDAARFAPMDTQAGQMIAGVLQPGGESPERGTADILRLYSRAPWLRAALGRISYDVAATEWKLYKPLSTANGNRGRARYLQRSHDTAVRQKAITKMEMEGEVEEITEHPILDLLHSANPLHTGLQARKLTQIQLDSVGEAFWLIERNRLGLPQSLWPVPPHWIRYTPTPNNPFYFLQVRQWRAMIPMEHMIPFIDHDPENPYGRGVGVARSLGDEIEIDEYAAKTVKAFFFNRAKPDLIVWPTGGESLQSSEVRKLENNWNRQNRGFWRGWRTHFMRRAVDVKVIDTNFRAQQFNQLREFERDTILQTFGVSPEILGIIRPGSSRATTATSDRIYARRVQVPRLELLRAVFQERLVPEYDTGSLIIDYCSPSIEDAEQDLAAGKVAPWALTQDEWRGKMGADPLPDGQGEVYLVPQNLRPVTNLLEAGMPPAAAAPPPPPSSPPEEPEEPEEPEDEPEMSAGHTPGREAGLDRSTSRRERMTRRSVSRRAFNTTMVAGAAAFLAPFVDLDDKASADEWAHHNVKAEDDWPEGTKLGDRLTRAYYNAQVESWKGVTADEGAVTAGIAAGDEKAILEAFGEAAIEGAVEGPALDHIEEAFLSGAELAVTLPGPPKDSKADPLDIDFRTVNPEATAWARAHAAELVVGATAETIEAIRAMIILSNELGIPPRKVARAMVNGNFIGRLPAQVNAANKLRAKLLEQGVSEAVVERRIARYEAAQLRLRAMTIARTETMMALNEGQQQLWLKAAKRGVLPENAKRVWLVALLGDWPCPQCEALANEETGLKEPFHDGTMRPPRHPRCRCTVGISRVPV